MYVIRLQQRAERLERRLAQIEATADTPMPLDAAMNTLADYLEIENELMGLDVATCDPDA